MSFVLQRVTGPGLVLNQIGGDVLRIGRGTSSDLRSENPAVALDHAVIEADAGGYSITDKGSITGTYVNRKPVESARLFKGDVIEIGDLRIEVQLADAERPLFLRIVSTATQRVRGVVEEEEEDEIVPQAGAGGTIVAPKIDYVSAFRLRRSYFTKTSLIALLAILSLVFVAEITQPGRQTMFMPGGVSSAHGRWPEVGNRCAACHDPWRGVVDARCTACHTHADKATPHAATQAVTPPCTSCHAEHRGAFKLAIVPNERCASCHADLQAHVKAGVTVKPAIAHVPLFGAGHPDFHYPPDTDSLRFSHAYHLQKAGVLNAKGRREVLQCTTCHAIKDNVDPKPITFAADCQRCHRLTFSARFPDDELPHGGDPSVAYAHVLGVYSNQGAYLSKSADELRRLATTGSLPGVSEQVLVTSQQVFKATCRLCHEVSGAGMKVTITPPVMLPHWLTARVRFTHGPNHSSLNCESCHETARRSTVAREVAMPSRKDCVACHGAGDDKPASRCVTCHEYHVRTKSPTPQTASVLPPMKSGGMQRMMGTILICTVVVLLLVVLVPVGAALYQRLRPPKEQPRRAAAAPRPVPPRPSGPQPTMKIPALGGPAPPAAPAPPSPPRESTVIINDPTAAPAGTELVQWYGMLTCTSGVLEGQRFVVEDEGFYIGRDSALSQVVIPDGRVSKRHVRIVPRDGRVHAIDQGSTNGTFLASKREERITDVQLKRGDTIVLADNVATFLYQV